MIRSHKLIPMIFAAFLLISMTVFSLTAAAAPSGGYLCGDADNSGEVDIRDATVIQRVTIGMMSDDDGMIEKRADFQGDGLDISDATFIQRWLVRIELPFPINQWIEPVAPTEKPTQNKDPYELPIV